MVELYFNAFLETAGDPGSGHNQMKQDPLALSAVSVIANATSTFPGTCKRNMNACNTVQA